jgi:hypothetical protein
LIRAAKMVDIPRIVDLLVEMQTRSKYAGSVDVDVPHAKKVIGAFIQRAPGSHDGGTLVKVVEHKGIVEGFIVGILDRIYGIGDKLVANDVFLHCTTKAPPGSVLGLFRSYVRWAEENPKVVEIKASWIDTLSGAEKVAVMYERLGFKKVGEIFGRGAR